MKRLLGPELRRDNEGISAVIGAILMVAVTVMLAATVYTVVNGFGGDGVGAPTNAAFKVQAIDTDDDGVTDTMKLIYVSGPNLDVGKVRIVAPGVSWVGTPSATWSAGDFITAAPGAGGWPVTVSVSGATVLDQTVNLGE
ncbi:MAG TPA: type IV pilin [Candidatus Thermoplasmatota archaeon]|nr:type IV pilin [Candidatus Thermoplasmatota archaeon]